MRDEERTGLRDGAPETIGAAAIPVYFHAGPITGDYTYDISGRGSVHFHVTLYGPIDVRPVRKALTRRFGGFRRCDVVCFGGPLGQAGEWGVLHAEITVPLLPTRVLDDFTKRLIGHIYLQHSGCRPKEDPRDGSAPLGKPLQQYRVR